MPFPMRNPARRRKSRPIWQHSHGNQKDLAINCLFAKLTKTFRNGIINPYFIGPLLLTVESGAPHGAEASSADRLGTLSPWLGEVCLFVFFWRFV